ncbi:hypothetical protein EKL28_18255, partial [Staphylococcus aureus]
NQNQTAQQAPVAQQAPAQVAAPAASPCAWLENLFVQKQAATVDQSRTANNAAAAIEQLVNNGAVSRNNQHQNQQNQNQTAQQAPVAQQAPAQVAAPAASPCAWLENL